MSEPTPPTTKSVSFWRKPAVIGVAAGAATVLVLGGIAAAITVQMTQNNEVSDSGASSPMPTPTAAPTAQPPASPTPEQSSGALAPSDAASLRAAITAAVAAAGAVGATEIDVEASGYEVEVQRADGTEAEVFVTVDGTATVRDEDDDDEDPLINLEQLDDLVRISIEAAGGGVIEQISTDDDDDHFYEVDVRLDDGTDVEIKLDANLNVLEIDRD